MGVGTWEQVRAEFGFTLSSKISKKGGATCGCSCGARFTQPFRHVIILQSKYWTLFQAISSGVAVLMPSFGAGHT